MAPGIRGEKRKGYVDEGWDGIRESSAGCSHPCRVTRKSRGQGKSEFLLVKPSGQEQTHPSSNGCLLEDHCLLLASNVAEVIQGLPVRQVLKAQELPLPS